MLGRRIKMIYRHRQRSGKNDWHRKSVASTRSWKILQKHTDEAVKTVCKSRTRTHECIMQVRATSRNPIFYFNSFISYEYPPPW